MSFFFSFLANDLTLHMGFITLTYIRSPDFNTLSVILLVYNAKNIQFLKLILAWMHI